MSRKLTSEERTKVTDQVRKWRAAHPEQNRATAARYREAHREKTRAKTRAHYLANKDLYKQRAAEWKRKNPESIRRAQKKYREKNKDRDSLKIRAQKFGLSPEQQLAMLELQGGACAICGTELRLIGDKLAHIDHDHASGVVRGILCVRCNIGIGMMKDSPDRLRSAAAYLDRSRP